MFHSRLCLRSFLTFAAACGLLLAGQSLASAQTGQGQGQGQGGQGQGGIGGGQIGGGGGTTVGSDGSLGGVAGQLAGPELMTFGQELDATGGTGFAGRGNASENFVGGLVQEGQGQGQFGNAGRNFNNQFTNINRQGQTRRDFQQPTGPSRADLIRPRHRVSFDFTPRPAEIVNSSLQTRLGNQPSSVNGVNVSLNEQGVATLSGTVADEHAAKLAAALARLEPGVRTIDNQLTVAGE